MSRLLVSAFLLPAALAGLCATGTGGVQTREEKVRNDRQKVEAEGFWIYNDLAKGFAEARKSGKPLLVVLRCIPCEECVKLDDDLVNQDPRVRPLLDKFVRVRLVSANGLDLSLFQFDTDQSFAVFLLNADGTIYGRFGTRSHRTVWADDVSVEGLARALEGALALHKRYPKNRAELAAKRGPAPEFTTPENYPLLKGKYGSQLDYSGNVARSCIHCHQIGDAQRQWYRNRPGPFPEKVLFPYSHPRSIGLILDPKERATVRQTQPDSPAARAGFQKGDVIQKMEGQPLLSIADVQWVLHQADPNGASLKAEVRRGDRNVVVALSLPRGWRQRDDLSWRASTWELRRMVTGGMLLASAPADLRRKLRLTEGDMALMVEHVGEYSPHDAARKAGFRKGDVVISFDGKTTLRRESDLIAYALTRCQPGAQVDVTVLRSEEKLTLTLPMQP